MWNELVYKLLWSVEAEYVSTGIRKEHSLAKAKQLNGIKHSTTMGELNQAAFTYS